tara:strand:- start:1001 stop:1672 length:672 start_codon:yes stop_codon:yes gene_type:complete
MTALPPETDFSNPTPNTQAQWKSEFADLHAFLDGLFGSTGVLATSRTAFGLGSSATIDVGTGASEIVQLNGSAELPAVDGSNLTGLSSEFVTGGTVKVVFWSASPPTGWTKSATNDYVLRSTSGTGGGTAGSVSIAGGSSNTSTTGNHSHGVGSYSVGAHTHQVSPDAYDHKPSAGTNGGLNTTVTSSSTQPSFTGSSSTTGNHSHSLTFAIKYINAILCSKD